jgi:chorismate mutase
VYLAILRSTFITVPEFRLPLVTLKSSAEILTLQESEPIGSLFIFLEFIFGGIMSIRGIRGATTVQYDRPELILSATQQLLTAMIHANQGLIPEDVASAFFTVTDDLESVHPAQAARMMGWSAVPMMCAREIPVPGSLAKCIRVLVHWNTSNSQIGVKHVYLNEAVLLRPDLVNP